MINKCNGCGAIFQTSDKDKEGYVENLENGLCERCFRIRNYNEYKIIDKSNDSFIEILKSINKTNSLVVLIVDALNINKNLKEITKYLTNDILLVYTKRDLLPKSMNDLKIYDYDIGIKVKDEIIISSNKNYNLDELYELIYKYKTDNNVYFVGYSNTGKSTLINKIIYNYSDIDTNITTSNLPSTTIDSIEIKINDELTLIDMPGILEKGNITNYLNNKELKIIQPKREIKPVTYQVGQKQYILLGDLVVIETEDNDFTIYVSNTLEKTRKYKSFEHDLKENIIRTDYNEDIVILGLGFIKVNNPGVFIIYTLEGVDVFTRKSLI